MANQKDIVTLPSPLLRQRSKVVLADDKKVVQLVGDMETATLDWEKQRPHELGVAMAAVQIGRLERVIIIRQDDDEDDQEPKFMVLINPKIIRQDGELITAHEGCLSVPDLYGEVPRYSKIKLQAQTLDGRTVRIKAKDFLARVIQHELDHLDGKLFIDYIKNKQFFKLDKEGQYQPLTKDELKKYSFLR